MWRFNGGAPALGAVLLPCLGVTMRHILRQYAVLHFFNSVEIEI